MIHPNFRNYPDIGEASGYVAADLDSLTSFFEGWLGRLHSNLSIYNEAKSLEEAFSYSTRLNDHPIVLSRTASDYTAIFVKGYSAVWNPVIYATQQLEVRGFVFGYRKNTYSPKTGEGIPGAVQMSVLSGSTDDSKNQQRTLSLTNQCSSWDFENDGEVLPFEDTSAYSRKKKVERFSLQALVAYANAVGIHLYDPNFYEGRPTVIRRS